MKKATSPLEGLLILTLTACASATPAVLPTVAAQPTSTMAPTLAPSPEPTLAPTLAPTLEPISLGPDVFLFSADPQRTGVFDLTAVRQTPQVKWEAQISNYLLSPPLLAGDMLYVGTYNGAIFALDAGTGETRWRIEETGSMEGIEKSMAVAGDILIVGGADAVVEARDRRDGTLRWTFEPGEFVFAPPLIVAERVVIATSHYLHALDLQAGRLIWQRPLAATDFYASPPVFNGGVVYASADSVLAAFDAGTGDELWRLNAETPYFGLATAHNLLYTGNGDGRFYAYDPQTGEERWHFEIEEQSQVGYWPPPAIAGEVLFAGNSNRHVYALNALTGELLWNFRADDWAISGLSYAGGLLYFSDSEHEVALGLRRLYALDGQTGELVWEHIVRSTLLTTPALGDGTIYISTTGSVYALE